MLEESTPVKEKLSAVFKILELLNVSPDIIESANFNTLRRNNIFNETLLF